MKKNLLSGVFTALVFSIFAQMQVGQTTYDLQTNVANCRRVATNPSGDISISYTRSNQNNTSWSDRGTGYNYSSDSGATWSENSWTGVFNRPDSARTGWPNTVYTSTKEVIASHLSGGTPAGGVQILRRDIGTGAWEKQVLLTETDATWIRMASSGDSIVLIYGLFTTTMPGMTSGGMGMYTSADAGATWVGPIDVPMVNSTNFTSIGGDVYSIDMNSNGKIAIALGAYQVEVLTSTDFGASFTKQTVVEVIDLDGNANSLFDGLSGESMVLTDGSDGSYSVVVDDNDLVHLWFGRYQLSKEELTTTGVSYLPASVGLIYWNENMTAGKILHETRLAAQQMEINFPWTSNQYFNPTSGWGTQLDFYRQNLVSMPSGGYDTNGNIYVAYSSLRAGIFTDVTDASTVSNLDANDFHFMDVYMIKSPDNGATWIGPINVSNETNRECVYPGVPRKVFGTNVPLIWQEDEGVGVTLQQPAGQSVPGTTNEIMFTNVDLSTIITPVDITAPTLTFIDDLNNTIQSAVGCNVDYTSIFTNDDVPTGPNVLDYLLVDPSILNTPGVHNVQVYVLDAAGNSSDTADVVLTLDPGPAASLVGPDSVDVLLNETYTDPGLDFLASYCMPSSGPNITNNVDETTLGTYTYEYQYLDFQGNSVTIIRYVTVVLSDDAAPVITLEGSSSLTVEACTAFSEEGYTAFDNIEYDVTASVTDNLSTIDLSVPGVYTLTYSVTDSSGNTGTASRTLTVEDTEAPIITISIIGSHFVELGDASNILPLVTASDLYDCDPNYTLTNDANTVVDINTVGSYVVTFTAKDGSLNTSTKQLNVIVGTTSIVALNKLNAAVNVYPNPSEGIINVNIEENNLTNVKVTISNLIGEIISSKTVKNTSNTKLTTFDLGNDAAGVYVVNISTENATVSKKVIVK